MKPKNIKTHYGEFPTLTHFERYWEDRVSKAYRDGFETGYRYFKYENLQQLKHKGKELDKEADRVNAVLDFLFKEAKG